MAGKAPPRYVLERYDDAPLELPAHVVRSRGIGIWLTWMCVNPYCREWTSDGAYLVGRCNHCSTPRPTATPSATA